MTQVEVLDAARDRGGGYKVDVSRGERIGRVSSEWFSRPDDERYLSLSELFASVLDRTERSRTRTVESAAIRVDASRDDAERLTLVLPGAEAPIAPTHWSFGQLASLVGAPATYLRQLPAPLAGINLQYGLTSHRAEQVKTLEIEDGRVELRAVTGPDYGRIFDHELVAAVQRIAGNGTGDTPGSVFDPAALTLGFARRFATYKRPNLLLHDPDRLARILLDGNRPVQLIMAGKAHPADADGQALVKQWTDFARRPDIRSRIVFLADYDMLMGQHLVRGVDLWINTPRRPWEASGTSGMKLLANGGLNLSELDGWWAEAYAPDVGWAVGDGREHGDDPALDAAEADMVYALLEREIVPEFYDRGADGIPARWVARIRASMARLAPQFSANRVVREYTESLYLPAAAGYAARTAERARQACEIVRWMQEISARWPALRFGAMRTDTEENARRVSVEIFFGDIAPEMIAVELYAEAEAEGNPPCRVAMEPQEEPRPANGARLYAATLPAGRSELSFTPRIVPRHPELRVPLEAPLILWQR